MLTNSADR